MVGVWVGSSVGVIVGVDVAVGSGVTPRYRTADAGTLSVVSAVVSIITDSSPTKPMT